MTTTPGINVNLDGAQQYHQALNTLNIIALTILLFDHLLTFADEVKKTLLPYDILIFCSCAQVKYIWSKKLKPFNILFLTNRYFASITMGFYVVGEFLPYNVQEHIYHKFQPGVISVVQTIPTVMIAEAILILRVYTIYEHNKFVLALLTLVWLAHICIACSVLTNHVLRVADLIAISYKFNLRLGLSFFVPAIVFDSLVAGFLTIGLYKRLRSFIADMPLANLIIRDGLLYFFAVWGSNIVWMVIGFILCNPESKSLGFAPMYTLSSATTTTMIGRLTLSLKAYQANDDELTFSSMSLRFAQSNSMANRTVGIHEGE